jgi:hypothetical protein
MSDPSDLSQVITNERPGDAPLIACIAPVFRHPRPSTHLSSSKSFRLRNRCISLHSAHCPFCRTQKKSLKSHAQLDQFARQTEPGFICLTEQTSHNDEERVHLRFFTRASKTARQAGAQAIVPQCSMPSAADLPGVEVCPSSEFLRQLVSPTKGGAGPSVVDVKRPARGAASADLRSSVV